MTQLVGSTLVRPNRRLLKMLCRNEITILDVTWADLTHPEDRGRDLLALAGVADGSTPSAAIDKRLLQCDGSSIWVHVTYSRFRVSDAHETSVFAVIEDISERRKIQGAANQALITLDAIEEATFSFSPGDMKFFYVNDAATRQTGYSRQQLLGKSLFDLQAADARDSLLALIEAAFSQPSSFHHLETEILCKGERRIPAEIGLRYISEVAEPPYFLAVVRNIADRIQGRKRLEDINAELESRVAQRTDDLRATNLLLRNKEEQIRAIVENIPSCVMTIDRDGIITSANAAVMTVFGMTVGGVIGREIDELVPQLHSEILRAVSSLAFLPPEAREKDRSVLLKGAFEGRTASLATRVLEVSAGSYELHGEQHYAAIIRDVTEEQGARRELIRARAQAEKSSREKSSFLAIMSHEIRTPMNGVLGMSELLLQRPLPKADREMVETIQQSAGALLGLLNDILDFSKIEAGKLEIESQPVEIDGLIECVCATYALLARSTHVELSAFISWHVPRTVQADAVRIRQILHNLIGNAVKFSGGRPEKAGRVSVLVDANTLQEDGVELILSIHDNGVGISPDVKDRLFTPFTQGETSTTRRFGGTGLGLSICKRLVDLMKGEITCASMPGVGSSFSVKLSYGSGQWISSQWSNVAKTGTAVVIAQDDSRRDDLSKLASIFFAGVHTFRATSEAAHWLARTGDECGDGEEGLLHSPTIIISEQMNSDERTYLDHIFSAAWGDELLYIGLVDGSAQRAALIERNVVLIGSLPLSAERLRGALGLVTGEMTLEEAGFRIDQEELYPLVEASPLLIAEDHQINQRVIQRQLQRLGVDGDLVVNGAQALERWRTGQYKAVLADLHMPVMNGYSLARAIRREETERGLVRTPIIAITANAITGEEKTCFAAGMDDVVTKPIDLHRLRSVIVTWVLGNADHGCDPLASPDTHSPLDISVLKRLVGDESSVVAEFLSDFEVSSSGLVDVLANIGLTEDWKRGASAAHRLKSSARSVGAVKLGAISEELEEALHSPPASTSAYEELYRAFHVEWMRVVDAIKAHRKGNEARND